MRNLVIGGLLREPYNNNDKPNMIILPMEEADSDALRLPKHLEEEGKKDHPDYWRGVVTSSTSVRAGVLVLAADVAAQKHPSETDMPAMKGSLVALSDSVYEAIITMAVAARPSRKTLDQLVSKS